MVTVTDCNDFPPVFSSPTYQFTLAERTSGPTSDENVFTGISVTDGDGTAANSVSVFSIAGAPASTNSWFGINSETVSGHVDIEYTAAHTTYTHFYCSYLNVSLYS